MDLKEFFKPTKWKAIVFAVFIVFLAVVWLALTGDYFGCNKVCAMPAILHVGGPECEPNPACMNLFVAVEIVSLVFLWPLLVVALVSSLLPTIEGAGIIPEIIVFALGIILSLAWLWFLSCLIVKIVKKFRKK